MLLLKKLHIPDLRTNLMFVSKIVDGGNKVTFKMDRAVVTTDKVLLLTVDRVGDLYYVNQIRKQETCATTVTDGKTKIVLLDELLGIFESKISCENGKKSRCFTTGFTK